MYTIVHNCKLALKWRNVYTVYTAVPSLAWPSHDMKISHECKTQACTPIAVNCVHNRRKQCSWLTRSTKSMVNSVSRLSSLTSFPMRSSIMSRAQSASTDSRSVFDRFGTRTAIFFLFEKFDFETLEIRYTSFYRTNVCVSILCCKQTLFFFFRFESNSNLILSLFLVSIFF